MQPSAMRLSLMMRPPARASPLRWLPIGVGSMGSRINASRHGCRSGPKMQLGWRRRLSEMSTGRADIDAAGLTQIALGDGAGDRHRLLPMRESVFDLFPTVRRRNAT